MTAEAGGDKDGGQTHVRTQKHKQKPMAQDRKQTHPETPPSVPSGNCKSYQDTRC